MSYNWGAFVTKQWRKASNHVWATIDAVSAELRPGDYGPIVNGGFTRIGNVGIALATSTLQAEGNYNFQTSSVKTGGGRSMRPLSTSIRRPAWR